MRLILLGTKGGPRLSVTRGSPAQVIVTQDRVVVVDCGEGTPRQLLRAGITLPDVTDILITHHHCDHNGGYGSALLMAWAAGLRRPVRAYGPPPLAHMTSAFFEMNAYDLNLRVRDEGRIPLPDLVQVTEIGQEGAVLEDSQIRVVARRVNHPPVEPAYAYRVEADGRSVVISGDTTPCDGLAELAAGADVLVHEVMHPAFLEERIRPHVPNSTWELMLRHLTRSHTSVDDVGKVAAAAGVRRLVLSHFVPADDDIPDSAWIDPVRRVFDGDIVAGRDLLDVDLD